MSKPQRVPLTRGYRIEFCGVVAFVSDVTPAKAKYQIISQAREHGWALPKNEWAAIYSCRRWPEGDGLAAICHRLED